MRIYAIDHAFLFGNVNNIRIFHPENPISTYQKLVKTQYFSSVLQFVDKDERMKIVDNCLDLALENHDNALQTAFSNIPEFWQIPESVIERIRLYVSDQKRLNQVKIEAIQNIVKK